MIHLCAIAKLHSQGRCQMPCMRQPEGAGRVGHTASTCTRVLAGRRCSIIMTFLPPCKRGLADLHPDPDSACRLAVLSPLDISFEVAAVEMLAPAPPSRLQQRLRDFAAAASVSQRGMLCRITCPLCSLLLPAVPRCMPRPAAARQL